MSAPLTSKKKTQNKTKQKQNELVKIPDYHYRHCLLIVYLERGEIILPTGSLTNMDSEHLQDKQWTDSFSFVMLATIATNIYM